jgi:hypothetical protein
MKYSLVQIKTKWNGKGWEKPIFSTDDADRVRSKSVPCGLGFYHYPAYFTKKRAWNKLKKYMIKRHKDEIARLEKSLNKLEKIEIN